MGLSFVLFSHNLESERLKRLEEEQEQLNSSLFALTTHFAQVQFRLKQIVDAPTEHKEVSQSPLNSLAHYHLYVNLHNLICNVIEYLYSASLNQRRSQSAMFLLGQ